MHEPPAPEHSGSCTQQIAEAGPPHVAPASGAKPRPHEDGEGRKEKASRVHRPPSPAHVGSAEQHSSPAGQSPRSTLPFAQSPRDTHA
jgi:hypothetical protein